MRTCLPSRLLLIGWNCTCEPNFVYPKCRVACCRSVSYISFRIKQDKQRYESNRRESLLLHLRRQSSYLACVIEQLILMLTRATSSSCWEFSTCLRAWTELVYSNCWNRGASIWLLESLMPEQARAERSAFDVKSSESLFDSFLLAFDSYLVSFQSCLMQFQDIYEVYR